jgi:hypothetical protein
MPMYWGSFWKVMGKSIIVTGEAVAEDEVDEEDAAG